MPACGPPSSLSPLNVTTSTPAASDEATLGSSRNAARSTSAPLPRSSATGRPNSRPSRGEFPHLDLLGEAHHLEVRGVHAQEERRLGRDGALVVGDAGLVRRPDLDETGAALPQHVGDAERPADLDQLPPGDDDLATGGQRGQHQEHRRGVVVDHHGGRRARQTCQQVADVVVARATGAGFQIVLQVRGVPGRLDDAGQSRLGQHRTTQVGVDDHARRVQHAAKVRPRPPGQDGRRPVDERRGSTASARPRRNRPASPVRRPVPGSSGEPRRRRSAGHRPPVRARARPAAPTSRRAAAAPPPRGGLAVSCGCCRPRVSFAAVRRLPARARGRRESVRWPTVVHQGTIAALMNPGSSISLAATRSGVTNSSSG